MKYMQTGGFQNQALMRLTLGLTLVFLLFFVVTGFALYFSKMSLDPASVVSYYNGSEEEFRPPRTAGSMLEVSHAHMAMMSLILLMLTHLFIFAPFSRRIKVWSISLAFGFGMLSEAGGWLVRFADPAFAIVKVVGFAGLQVTLIFLLVSLAMFVFNGHRQENSSSITFASETVEDVVEEEAVLP